MKLFKRKPKELTNSMVQYRQAQLVAQKIISNYNDMKARNTVIPEISRIIILINEGLRLQEEENERRLVESKI